MQNNFEGTFVLFVRKIARKLLLNIQCILVLYTLMIHVNVNKWMDLSTDTCTSNPLSLLNDTQSNLYFGYRIEDLITPHYCLCSNELCICIMRHDFDQSDACFKWNAIFWRWWKLFCCYVFMSSRACSVLRSKGQNCWNSHDLIGQYI